MRPWRGQRQVTEPIPYFSITEQFGAPPKRRVPADFPPLPVDLDHRPPDAVGILVQVAPDAGHTLGLNLQATHGFTQRTGVEVATVFADPGQRFGEPGASWCAQPLINMTYWAATCC